MRVISFLCLQKLHLQVPPCQVFTSCLKHVDFLTTLRTQGHDSIFWLPRTLHFLVQKSFGSLWELTGQGVFWKSTMANFLLKISFM